LAEGPLLVLTHGKPAAVLLEPSYYESLLERIELLEDMLDGRQVVSEYVDDPSVAIEAEEVFGHLGQS
jgi:PHD/YefM family antitoxin component YafN of YafNO toxin-antitoxin module